MSKIVMFIDGGEREFRRDNKLQCVYGGYGIVAHHNGDTEELFGGYEVKPNDRGFHELMAFKKAVDYAESFGYLPEEVAFYTDCRGNADAGFHLFPGNRSKSKSCTINRLRKFQKVHFPDDKGLVLRLARWFISARIHWVKGHEMTVDNCRADVLARAGTRMMKEKKKQETLNDWNYVETLNRWLHMGRKVYFKGGMEMEFWPFCGNAV